MTSFGAAVKRAVIAAALLTFLTSALLVTACGDAVSPGPVNSPNDASFVEAATVGDASGRADAGDAPHLADAAAGADEDAGVGDTGTMVDADGSTSFEGGPGCTVGTTVCGAPPQCGSVVQSVEILHAAPTPLGGTISPGLYLLTKANIYRSASGGANPTYQIARLFSSTMFATRIFLDGYASPPVSGTYMTTGPTLTLTITCEVSLPPTSVTYTSDGVSLTVYEEVGGNSDILELVHMKQ